MEEQITGARSEMNTNVNALRTETSANHQSLHSGLSRVTTHVNQVQEEVEVLKVFVNDQVEEVKTTVSSVKQTQDSLAIRQDSSEAALLANENSVLLLSETVQSLTGRIEGHDESLKRQSEKYEKMDTEIKLLKAKQMKTDAWVASQQSAPPTNRPPPPELPGCHSAPRSGPSTAPRYPNPADLYAVCPPLPSSPASIHKIQVAQLALRFSPVSLEVVDKLAEELDSVAIARVVAAKRFMAQALKMGQDVFQQVTVESAWPAHNEPALITKFSSKIDIDIVNSFKKNLCPPYQVSDVIPPCLFEVEKFLKIKGDEARHPGT